MGEIVDFVVDTARKPNRVLALSVAITVIGTLIGRRIAGPTMSGTHLYVVTLAPTGAGKDHALDMAPRLLHAAGASGLVGTDDFMSQSAVIESLERKPLSLCCMDEFGAFIKKITGSKSHHEQNIGKTLRTAWNRSFALMMTPQWAHSTKGGLGDSAPIYWPASTTFWSYPSLIRRTPETSRSRGWQSIRARWRLRISCFASELQGWWARCNR